MADGTAGIQYDRGPSEREAIFEAIRQEPIYRVPDDILRTPIKGRGIPGVVIFDHDRDGDLDLYVTNGPGRDNSLFSNQLRESGELTFVDLAASAGVVATSQDSCGAVAGDFDNDGDADLYVLGAFGGNLLFENNGDGTFRDITDDSGAGGGAGLTSESATLGDVNSDGLLDIFVANATDYRSNLAIFTAFPDIDQHNELFINLGANRFRDVSASAGITSHAGFPPGFENEPSLTHATSLVDYDLDGDVDLFTADDQGTVPPTALGGADNGLLHIFRNDGSGSFTDTSVSAGVNKIGGWMGLSFGDFNHDGELDFFASNVGTYALRAFGLPISPDAYNSRWFLGQENGSFLDPGVGELGAIPFGWGTSTLDYDNDGDTDIAFFGGLDFGPFVLADNPGVLLRNDGEAVFTQDGAARAASTNHSRRVVHGAAVGDLNGDGFVDIVSVSNFDYPEPLPLIPLPPLGSPFDATAFIYPTFVPTGVPGVLTFNTGLPPLPNGSLSIEINGGNSNGWVAIDTVGTLGFTTGGRVNRDGVGAVVRFTPRGGRPVMKPILAGSSYASQDSLTANFGLGRKPWGTVEVLWPGGVRNRLDLVHRGESVVFPEIPVSFDDPTLSLSQYVGEVLRSLNELVAAGVLKKRDRGRFLSSAIRAFHDHH